MIALTSNQGFTGRIAVISGGLGDIGGAIARQLHQAGCRVAVADCLPPEDAAIQREQLGLPGDILYRNCDVTSASAVQAWLQEVEELWGIADVVIPCAATATFKRALDLTPQEWEKEISVGLHGAFFMAQCAASKLVQHKKAGHMTFVGSWAAHAPHVHLPAYSVAKAGVRMLMQSLALELAPHGILVNEIAPGYVDAGLSGRIFARDAAIKQAATRKVPLNRLMSADEVAAQVLYLCHASNRHMTGSTLLMDGGLSLRGPADGIPSHD